MSTATAGCAGAQKHARPQNRCPTRAFLLQPLPGLVINRKPLFIVNRKRNKRKNESMRIGSIRKVVEGDRKMLANADREGVAEAPTTLDSTGKVLCLGST